MKLRAALAASEELARSFDLQVNGLTFPASDRSRLSAALLDQAHEHHKAIRSLVSANLCGSAFALSRILFETALRGVWLNRCASDEQVELFKGDKLDVSFGQIITAVETFFGSPGGVLERVKRDYWHAMCSFAHGGYLQAVRRITPEHIAPNYSEAETFEMVSFADFCFFVAAIEILEQANERELAKEWVRKFPVNVPTA